MHLLRSSQEVRQPILSSRTLQGVLTVDKYEHGNLFGVSLAQNRVWYGDDEIETLEFILWDVWGHFLLRG